MRAAVTGGTGCLGRPLISKLLESGIKTRLLVLTQEQIPEEFKQQVEIIYGCLDSIDDLMKLVVNCDVVFHLAGKVHTVPKTPNEEKEFYRVNVDGTRNLVSACIDSGVKRIVFYSTVGVYGKDGNFHGDERSKCEPVSVYAKTKVKAESIVLDCMNNGGPLGVILRLPVVYGAFDKGNVHRLIRAIRNKRFIIFGDGLSHRSFISALNATEAALCAAFGDVPESSVFCITDDNDYTMMEFVESICNALQTDWRPTHLSLSIATRIGKIADSFENIIHRSLPINSSIVDKLSSPLTFSCEKAKNVLNYKPIYSLDRGILDEVEWLVPKIKTLGN